MRVRSFVGAARSVRPRSFAGAVAAVLLTTLTGGCSSHLIGRLADQELVVHFGATATPAEHAAALKACAGYPNTTPEPPPGPSAPVASRLNDVRFRIDRASNYQLAQLEACLGRQPGVVGYDVPDSMG